MHITDSHFHTEMVIERGLDYKASFSMLSGGIDAGCDLNDIERRSKLLEGFDHIHLAAAMGPWCASDMAAEDLESALSQLEEKIQTYHAHFLGEIGLDYYWNYGTPELQKDLFQSQMLLANRLGFRILVHCRDAAGDVSNLIKSVRPSKAGVIHCFDGSEELLETALDCGFWISFAGNLTYKSNDHLRQMLKKVPRGKLLLETDAPYLTPVPLRGKPNCPANIIHTYECAAQVLGISVQQLSEQVFENFICFV